MSTTNTYTMDNEIKVSSVKNANVTTYYRQSMGWHRSYGQHGVYAKKAGIDFKSNMIWASQYNQATIWLKDVRNPSQGEHVYYVINSTGMKGTSTTTTGQVKVKNIYDLAGGIVECTPAIGYTGTVNNYRGPTRLGFDNLSKYSLISFYDNSSTVASRLVLF